MQDDLEDYEDLYPDVEFRGEGRPRKPKRPLPTVDSPAVYSLGWGVRVQLRDGSAPAGWLAPQGETAHPFWWARRASAERLAAAYERLGFVATVHHATRRRTCTSAAKNPWEPGYRASVDGPECGASIETREVPSLLAATLAKKAEKAATRERAEAARQNARDRKAQARARKTSYHFATGSDGDVRAIRYLLKHGLSDDESYGARAHLVAAHPRGGDLMYDDELDTNALRDLACGLAEDLAHSEPRRARALVQTLGGGVCRTAEEVLARVARERAGLREREAARAKAAAANTRAAEKARARDAAAMARAAAKAEKAEAAKLARAAKKAPPTMAENMARADAEHAAEMQRREAKAAKARAIREAREAREAAAKAAKAEAKAEKAAARNRRSEAAAAAMSRQIEARAAAKAARAPREEFAEKQPRLARRAPRQRVL